MLGQPGAGERLQRSYESMTGDRPPAQLIAWYTGTRALLRARLCALHSLEPGARPPAAWLAQAERYLDSRARLHRWRCPEAGRTAPSPASGSSRCSRRIASARSGATSSTVRRACNRLRLQPERRHRVGDDQPLEARAGQRALGIAGEQTVRDRRHGPRRAAGAAGRGGAGERAAGADQIVDDHRGAPLDAADHRVLAAEHAAASSLLEEGQRHVRRRAPRRAPRAAARRA